MRIRLRTNVAPHSGPCLIDATSLLDLVQQSFGTILTEFGRKSSKAMAGLAQFKGYALLRIVRPRNGLCPLFSVTSTLLVSSCGSPSPTINRGAATSGAWQRGHTFLLGNHVFKQST